jgi:FKBP-type peptidyl-prolyl cis-trans isomerase FkpA
MMAVLAACMKSENDDAQQRWLDEVDAIDTYLASEGVTPVKDLSGVRMVISKLGKGYPGKVYPNGTSSTSIDIDYVGNFFPDGAQFDAGNATGPLHGYIEGWKRAFQTLPEGSVAKLYVPSIYAYGPNGRNSIPGNAVLEFDVIFNKVVRSTTELQRLATDTVAIDNYLASNEIEAVKDSTGYRYVMTEPGTGPYIGPYTPLSFHVAYKVLSDPTILIEMDTAPNDGTQNRPMDQYADALKGVLPKLRAGSKVTIYSPSLLAFGTFGADNNIKQIPANANVIIEISDLKVVDN